MKMTDLWKKYRAFLSERMIRLLQGLVLRAAAVCLAGFLCLSFAGCAAAEEKAEDQMYLYYLQQDGDSIGAAPFHEDTSLADFLPENMLLQLSSQDRAPRGFQVPVSGFSVQSWSIKDTVMIINFSEEYLSLDNIRQILVRAALVHSLCQIDGIDSVLFLCRGNTLLDAEGNAIGNLSSSSYIYSSENEIGRYEKKDLHLYFANESGDRLVSSYRSVVYNSNIPIERVVVQEVLRGAEEGSGYPTLNPETRILSVTTRDRVCYVNLDSAFLTEPYQVTPQAAIYSLVNSLTELPSVLRVQLSVNGETDSSFMETMRLSTVYESNSSIVE